MMLSNIQKKEKIQQKTVKNTRRQQITTIYFAFLNCVLHSIECLKNSTTFPLYVIAFIGFSKISALNRFGPTTIAIFCGPILFVFSYLPISTHMSHNHKNIDLFGSTKSAITVSASFAL